MQLYPLLRFIVLNKLTTCLTRTCWIDASVCLYKTETTDLIYSCLEIYGNHLNCLSSWINMFHYTLKNYNPKPSTFIQQLVFKMPMLKFFW